MWTAKTSMVDSVWYIISLPLQLRSSSVNVSHFRPIISGGRVQMVSETYFIVSQSVTSNQDRKQSHSSGLFARFTRFRADGWWVSSNTEWPSVWSWLLLKLSLVKDMRSWKLLAGRWFKIRKMVPVWFSMFFFILWKLKNRSFQMMFAHHNFEKTF